MQFRKDFIIQLFVLLLVVACNPGKEKTASTEPGSPADSVKHEVINAGDSDHHTISLVDSPVTANRLIIPGKSIGLTSINEKNEEVRKQLGTPAKEDAGMGKELATWYSKPVATATDTLVNETDIFFSTNMGGPDEASRVNHIRITSPFFVDAQHIGTGSKLELIKKYYPGLAKLGSYDSPKTKNKVLIYDDILLGIAFEIDQEHSCIGITVHKTGEVAFEIYNSLFGDIGFF